MSGARFLPFACAGLAAGPGAWGVATQTGYTFAPHSCGGEATASTALAVALIVAALAGAAVSLAAARAPAADEDDPGGRPRLFLARVSAGVGLLFALVIASQFAAMALVDPCLR